MKEESYTPEDLLQYGRKRWRRVQYLALLLRNFFSKKNFDKGFEISSVGIPEISPYTKSEQPRIAGKHLTRHAKNGYSVVAI